MTALAPRHRPHALAIPQSITPPETITADSYSALATVRARGIHRGEYGRHDISPPYYADGRWHFIVYRRDRPAPDPRVRAGLILLTVLAPVTLLAVGLWWLAANPRLAVAGVALLGLAVWVRGARTVTVAVTNLVKVRVR